VLHKALYLPFFLSEACVSAEAATDLTPLGVEGFDNNLPAFEATFSEVFSFLLIIFIFKNNMRILCIKMIGCYLEYLFYQKIIEDEEVYKVQQTAYGYSAVIDYKLNVFLQNGKANINQYGDKV
jgi:hypothetical protein